ncbi:MAG: REP-associated tyrosine transposase [Acidobacteriaceae bacterium]
MPTGLQRFYSARDLHFITCSCYQRRPFLHAADRRDLFLQILEETRQNYQFAVTGYVVMPEHFHLLVSEPERGTLSLVMQVLKQRYSKSIHDKAEKQFWQRRFYDFNVWTGAKHIEKLRYMHRNPIKRGLVEEPDEWAWSSFRAYAYQEKGIVKVEG